uniref:Uncharacterized protein n=1 Tax=Rhizophora mucronata TaxID=61149 RepID=A0A2P2LSJ8_RHIMU
MIEEETSSGACLIGELDVKNLKSQ